MGSQAGRSGGGLGSQGGKIQERHSGVQLRLDQSMRFGVAKIGMASRAVFGRGGSVGLGRAAWGER